MVVTGMIRAYVLFLSESVLKDRLAEKEKIVELASVFLFTESGR